MTYTVNSLHYEQEYVNDSLVRETGSQEREPLWRSSLVSYRSHSYKDYERWWVPLTSTHSLILNSRSCRQGFGEPFHTLSRHCREGMKCGEDEALALVCVQHAQGYAPHPRAFGTLFRHCRDTVGKGLAYPSTHCRDTVAKA